MSDARDDVLIAVVLDAALVLDDYLGSLLGAARGDLGGGQSTRFARVRRFFSAQERELVRGFAIGYGPDQLRKASVAAGDLAVAVGELEAAESEPARALRTEVAGLAITELPELLARDDLAVSSPELVDAHRRLGRAVAAMRRAQTARTLGRMRAERRGDPAD